MRRLDRIKTADRCKAVCCNRHRLVESVQSQLESTVGTGIARLAKNHLAATDAPSSLRAMDAVIAKDVFDAGKAGDAVALEIMDIFFDYMGQFLGSLCSAVDPEVVVLGGGVSKAGDVLIAGVEKAFLKYVFHAASGAKFALASLFNDAGAYGAFKLALDAFN